MDPMIFQCIFKIDEWLLLFTVCRGRYDLALAIESTDTIGKNGFRKIKEFAKQLVEAFAISQANTQVSLITFGARADGRLWFNSLTGSSMNVVSVKQAIDGLDFVGGTIASTSSALQVALDSVFTASGGSRENANKVRENDFKSDIYTLPDFFKSPSLVSQCSLVQVYKLPYIHHLQDFK